MQAFARYRALGALPRERLQARNSAAFDASTQAQAEIDAAVNDATCLVQSELKATLLQLSGDVAAALVDERKGLIARMQAADNREILALSKLS